MSCLASMMNNRCGCVMYGIKYDDKPVCKGENSSVGKPLLFFLFARSFRFAFRKQHGKEKVITSNLHTSRLMQITHHAGAYPGFLN